MNNNLILNFDSHIIRDKKINLVKNQKFQKKNISISYKIIKIIDENELLEEKFKKIIKTFINTLIEKNTYLDLTLFMINIETLEIIVTDKLPRCFSAAYDYKNNTIYINKNYIDDDNLEEYIFHELFHVLGRKEQKDVYYSGLHDEFMGTGINEGYVHHLVLKYFYKPFYKDMYELEQEIANIIEIIIGEEKLEKIYSKAEFWVFLEELSEYCKDSYRFISEMDNVHNSKNNRDSDNLNLALTNAIRMLLEMFFKKQQIELVSNHDIERFFSSIQNSITLSKVRFKLSITLEDIQNYKVEFYNLQKLKI